MTMPNISDDQLAELLEVIRKIPDRSESLTVDTPVPVKVTPKQAWIGLVGLIVFIASLSGGIYAIAADRAEFRRELLKLREDFVRMADENKQSITHTMIELDSTWQVRLLQATNEIRAVSSESSSNLEKALLELQGRIPKEFPPQVWLEDVYRRDRELMIERIRKIEEKLSP